MRRALILVAIAALVLLVAGCGKSAESVKVPSIGEANPGDAYSLLRKAGLKVSVSVDKTLDYNSTGGFGFEQHAFTWASSVSQTPAPSTTVSPGSAVTLTIRPVNPGSRAFRTSSSTNCSRRPKTVPNLTGRSLSSAVNTFSGCFSISAKLPPLQAAEAPQLLDNYEIEHQSPTPGSAVPEVSASTLAGPVALDVEVSVKH
jgi:beta-lactam-binding protein with PASTA domain